MYKIIFTPYSLGDISFIQSYIWEYSQIVLLKIFHTISHLSYFSKIWFVRKDWYSEIIDSKYKFRIIYKIDERNKIYLYNCYF